MTSEISSAPPSMIHHSVAIAAAAGPAGSRVEKSPPQPPSAIEATTGTFQPRPDFVERVFVNGGAG